MTILSRTVFRHYHWQEPDPFVEAAFLDEMAGTYAQDCYKKIRLEIIIEGPE